MGCVSMDSGWYFLLGAQCSARCLSFGVFFVFSSSLQTLFHVRIPLTDCLCSDTRTLSMAIVREPLLEGSCYSCSLFAIALMSEHNY
jgi:hypothetical protein